MKRSSIYILIISVLALYACDKDETRAVVSADAVKPALTTSTSEISIEVTSDNLDEVLLFEWSESDYGVSTEVSYVLEADTAGNDFSGAVTIGETTSDTLEVTFTNLNDVLLNDLEMTPNTQATIDFRLISTISGQRELVSDKVTLQIQSWQEVEETTDMLWLPGEYNEWSFDDESAIREIDDNVFEGYIYFSAASSFKFTNASDWTHTNYGDSGTEGLLTADGTAGNLSVSTSGYYKLYVNTTTLEYEITLVKSWGLIGTATENDWDSDIDMEYDVDANVWTKTVALEAGSLKFRANDAWDLDYGPADVSLLEGELITTTDAINISESGTYTITIDLSRSALPYTYQYKVVKN